METEKLEALCKNFKAGRIIAQLNPPATTLTDLYEVPANTDTLIYFIFLCNQDAVEESYRLSIALDDEYGTEDDEKQYLLHGKSTLANDTEILDFSPHGLLLGSGTIVRVYTSTANFSINVIGIEMESGI